VADRVYDVSVAKAKNTQPEGDQDEILLEPPAPPRKQLSQLEQVQRNMKIVRMRVRRRPWWKIAEDTDLTIRRCQQIFEEWKGTNPTLRTHEPVKIVDEILYGLEATIEDLAEMIADDKNSTLVKLGAQNSKLRAYREMAEILQAIGALPNDLGTIQLQVDGQITAERVIMVMEKFNLPDAAFAELLDALGGPPPELTSGTN
jgi:hypothetical protein